MTNAEKYKEVFGFEPDKSQCITQYCIDCPIQKCIPYGTEIIEWWMDDYKGVNNGKEENT